MLQNFIHYSQDLPYELFGIVAPNGLFQFFIVAVSTVRYRWIVNICSLFSRSTGLFGLIPFFKGSFFSQADRFLKITFGCIRVCFSRLATSPKYIQGLALSSAASVLESKLLFDLADKFFIVECFSAGQILSGIFASGISERIRAIGSGLPDNLSDQGCGRSLG